MCVSVLCATPLRPGIVHSFPVQTQFFSNFGCLVDAQVAHSSQSSKKNGALTAASHVPTLLSMYLEGATHPIAVAMHVTTDTIDFVVVSQAVNGGSTQSATIIRLTYLLSMGYDSRAFWHVKTPHARSILYFVSNWKLCARSCLFIGYPEAEPGVPHWLAPFISPTKIRSSVL